MEVEIIDCAENSVGRYLYIGLDGAGRVSGPRVIKPLASVSNGSPSLWPTQNTTQI